MFTLHWAIQNDYNDNLNLCSTFQGTQGHFSWREEHRQANQTQYISKDSESECNIYWDLMEHDWDMTFKMVFEKPGLMLCCRYCGTSYTKSSVPKCLEAGVRVWKHAQVRSTVSGLGYTTVYMCFVEQGPRGVCRWSGTSLLATRDGGGWGVLNITLVKKKVSLYIFNCYLSNTWGRCRKGTGTKIIIIHDNS